MVPVKGCLPVCLSIATAQLCMQCICATKKFAREELVLFCVPDQDRKYGKQHCTIEISLLEHHRCEWEAEYCEVRSHAHAHAVLVHVAQLCSPKATFVLPLYLRSEMLNHAGGCQQRGTTSMSCEGVVCWVQGSRSRGEVPYSWPRDVFFVHLSVPPHNSNGCHGG